MNFPARDQIYKLSQNDYFVIGNLYGTDAADPNLVGGLQWTINKVKESGKPSTIWLGWLHVGQNSSILLNDVENLTIKAFGPISYYSFSPGVHREILSSSWVTIPLLNILNCNNIRIENINITSHYNCSTQIGTTYMITTNSSNNITFDGVGIYNHMFSGRVGPPNMLCNGCSNVKILNSYIGGYKRHAIDSMVKLQNVQDSLINNSVITTYNFDEIGSYANLQIQGNNNKILNNKITIGNDYPNGTAIALSGSNNTVLGNNLFITGWNSNCIYYSSGSGGTISLNNIRNSHHGINSNGLRTSIIGNYISNCNSAITIPNNTYSSAYNNVFHSCSGYSIGTNNYHSNEVIP